jgi:hypothetical protein
MSSLNTTSNFYVNCQYIVSFQVFAMMTTKNTVFWDATPGGARKNRRFVEFIATFIKEENQLARNVNSN